MTTEAKSKRDLIWEQKRKAREDRLKGGNILLNILMSGVDQGGELFSDQPKLDFSKKSPLFNDNENTDSSNKDRDL
jgi:hypothetical protein